MFEANSKKNGVSAATMNVMRPNRGGLKRFPRRSRRGSVQQFGLWLVLAIIVIAAAFQVFGGLRHDVKANALRSMLIKAQTTIESRHGYSGIYANQSLLVFLKDTGFSDKELQRVSAGNYVFTSPFDTAITITGNGARDFTMSVADLPTAGCVAALEAFQDNGSGLDSASVGSTNMALPMTEVAIATACDNTTNTVNLTF
jgi:hypothetical protein